MFSSTLKQSVATLGVVAGLAGGYVATDPSSEVDNQIRLSIGGAEAAGFVKAPANAVSVSNEAVDLMNNWVKAPAKTWTDGNNQPADFETVSSTFRGAAFRGEVIGLEPT
jgi:hypothetical protein